MIVRYETLPIATLRALQSACCLDIQYLTSFSLASSLYNYTIMNSCRQSSKATKNTSIDSRSLAHNDNVIIMLCLGAHAQARYTVVEERKKKCKKKEE